MTDMPNDGRFYSKDGEVHRRPRERVLNERGQKAITLGFRVCVCDEFVTGAAELIADALNAALDRGEVT